jgi:hypothetical protein
VFRPYVARARMTAPANETTRDYSRGDGADRGVSGRFGGLPAALLALGALGAAALILSDFSTLFAVPIPGQAARTVTGHQQHNYALLIDGLAVLVLLYSASQGGRLAMLAVAVLGLVALGIAVIGDLGDVHATRFLALQLVDVQASPRAGFYEETLGAAVLLISGGGLLLLEGAASGAGGADYQR